VQDKIISTDGIKIIEEILNWFKGSVNAKLIVAKPAPIYFALCKIKRDSCI